MALEAFLFVFLYFCGDLASTRCIKGVLDDRISFQKMGIVDKHIPLNCIEFLGCLREGTIIKNNTSARNSSARVDKVTTNYLNGALFMIPKTGYLAVYYI